MIAKFNMAMSFRLKHGIRRDLGASSFLLEMVQNHEDDPIQLDGVNLKARAMYIQWINLPVTPCNTTLIVKRFGGFNLVPTSPDPSLATPMLTMGDLRRCNPRMFQVDLQSSLYNFERVFLPIIETADKKTFRVDFHNLRLMKDLVLGALDLKRTDADPFPLSVLFKSVERMGFAPESHGTALLMLVTGQNKRLRLEKKTLCGVKGCIVATNLKFCPMCQSVMYCSIKCQMNDFDHHKEECKHAVTSR